MGMPSATRASSGSPTPFANRSGPADAIMRYGGDEFLVVAPGMDGAAALARVDLLRGRG